MLEIKGFGSKTFESYGNDIINIISNKKNFIFNC